MSHLAYMIFASCNNELELDLDVLYSKCERWNSSFTNALLYAQKLGLYSYY